MRIFKRLLLGLLALFLLSAVGGYIYFKVKFKPPPSQLVLSAPRNEIPFEWVSETLGSRVDSTAAMLLPITLEGCPRKLYMQFDLGAPTSLFYKNKLEAIRDRYQNIRLEQQDKSAVLNDFAFKLGEAAVRAKTIAARQFDSTGIDWSNDSTIEIVGTIGTDLFEGKTLVIDYPGQRLVVSDGIPAAYARKATWGDFAFENRRVLLPSTIQGNKTTIFYDSGTSTFELMTDKKTWEALSRNGAKPERYTVNSWGNKLTVNTAPTDETITFNSLTIPLHRVTYLEGTSFFQQLLMKAGGVGGLTGNKLFLDKVVVLDTKAQKFALLPK